MTPLESAARDAERTEAALLDELLATQDLLDVTEAGCANYIDTYDAWERAKQRTREATQLADHYAGIYNAWAS